jgi:hypothetical protein
MSVMMESVSCHDLCQSHCICVHAGSQYQSLQKLLEAFSSFSVRAPNRYLRPSGRPDSPANVRRWWQYAGAVIRKQIRSQAFNWRQFEKVSLACVACPEAKSGPWHFIGTRRWIVNCE